MRVNSVKKKWYLVIDSCAYYCVYQIGIFDPSFEEKAFWTASSSTAFQEDYDTEINESQTIEWRHASRIFNLYNFNSRGEQICRSYTYRHR